MQHQKIIEQLGYSAKEAKVYLASLALGESHVSDIATMVKMPRSTVQVIVDRLHQDGLMNFYVMRRYKYWVAEKPEKLLENLKKREEVIAQALPELSALRQMNRQRGDKTDQLHQESLALLRDFSETSLLPILITNSDVEIVYVNTAWQNEFGFTLEEMQGENPRILRSSETPRSEYTTLWRTLKQDRLFESDKIINRRKDGSLINMVTAIFSVHHGNRKFYVQILNSVSKKNEVEVLYQSFPKTKI